MDRLTAVVYGPPKVGKTVGLVSAFSTGIFAGPFGGTKGVKSARFLGIDISKQATDCTNLDTATAVLREKGNDVPSIVYDDFTAVCDNTYEELRRRFRGNSNKYIVPDTFNSQLHTFILTMDTVRCDVALSMWDQPGKALPTGRVMKGCPQIAGWRWPEKFAGLFDFVAHVEYNAVFKPWPYVYQVGPNPDYITGDRNDVAPAQFPQNLAEILRRAGRKVPRLKGLGWMDGVVDALAEPLAQKLDEEGFDLKTFLKEKTQNIKTKLADKAIPHNDRQIRWALMNSLDRANLLRAEAGLLDAFIDAVSTPAGSATSEDI